MGSGSHRVLQVLPASYGFKLPELLPLQTPVDHPLQVDGVTLVQPGSRTHLSITPKPTGPQLAPDWLPEVFPGSVGHQVPGPAVGDLMSDHLRNTDTIPPGLTCPLKPRPHGDPGVTRVLLTPDRDLSPA